MAGSHEKSNELWVSMKCWEFLDVVRNCQILKSSMRLISYVVRLKQTIENALTVSYPQQNTGYCCTAL